MKAVRGNADKGTALSSRLAAFTLVELLVTVAVVALLCAMAMQGWQKVLQTSGTVQCQQHLRNLANAGLLYAADHQGKLPDRSGWTYSTVGGREFSLLPYLGVPVDENISDEAIAKIWLCPVAKRSDYNLPNLNRSYSINQYATGSDHASPSTWQTQVFSRDSPIRLANVRNPSKQAFFMDGTFVNDTRGYSAFQDSARLEARSSVEASGWKTPYLHNGAIYVAFLDGHVERVTREYAETELIGPANPSASQAHTSPRRHAFWGAEK